MNYSGGQISKKKKKKTWHLAGAVKTTVSRGEAFGIILRMLHFVVS